MTDRYGLWPLVVVAAATILVATAGAALTKLGPWYRALDKPPWQPPDWVFGPTWTLIFFLAAWAALEGWSASMDPTRRTVFVLLFVANGALNVLWSVLFFRWERPDWALIEVVPFAATVAALIAVLWPVAPRGALLLLPYLAWTLFATVLNVAIIRRNAPFPRS